MSCLKILGHTLTPRLTISVQIFIFCTCSSAPRRAEDQVTRPAVSYSVLEGFSWTWMDCAKRNIQWVAKAIIPQKVPVWLKATTKHYQKRVNKPQKNAPPPDVPSQIPQTTTTSPRPYDDQTVGTPLDSEAKAKRVRGPDAWRADTRPSACACGATKFLWPLGWLTGERRRGDGWWVKKVRRWRHEVFGILERCPLGGLWIMSFGISLGSTRKGSFQARSLSFYAAVLPLWFFSLEQRILCATGNWCLTWPGLLGEFGWLDDVGFVTWEDLFCNGWLQEIWSFSHSPMAWSQDSYHQLRVRTGDEMRAKIQAIS